MKRLSLALLVCLMMVVFTASGSAEAEHARLLYMGQASIRIVTAENKVIYIDPYAGDQYR